MHWLQFFLKKVVSEGSVASFNFSRMLTILIKRYLFQNKIYY